MSIIDQFETFDDGSDDIVNELPGTLYAYRVTKWPEDVDLDVWEEYCMGVWGEPKDFFLPSQRKVWRSRSSAQERVDIVRSWGGDAEILICHPSWETVEAYNHRRGRAKKLDRIARLQVQLDNLKGEL